MADTSVARSDRDIFELDIHVIFSYSSHKSALSSLVLSEWHREIMYRTFKELATVDLAGSDLESNDMALEEAVSRARI
jgi:hypothetical protein